MNNNLTLHESTVEVDGVRVHFSRAGSGPALVLVHGLVGSARNWEQNIDEFARYRTVYALDLVNMGESERVVVDAGLDATADRVARCMDVLGIETADIASHSHGGAISMMLAARHPDRVRKLILFAPANPFCEMGRGLIRFYNTRAGSFFARLIPMMPRILHDIAHRRMYYDQRRVTRSALDGYTDGLNREAIEHVLRIVGAWWGDMARLRDRLPEVAGAKTLLIWGDHDRAVGVRSGRQLAEALGAQMVLVEGTGHLPFQEKPRECNLAVRQWLLA